MESQRKWGRYTPEARAQAVRMVSEYAGEHGSQWEAITSVAGKVGCAADTLRRWVRQAEREKPTGVDQTRIWELERENRKLRQANEILRKALACFVQADLDRWFES